MITYRLNTIPGYEYSRTVVHLNENDSGGTIGFQVYEGDSLLPMGGTYGACTITLNIYKADETVYSEEVGSWGSETGYDTEQMEDGYFEVTLAEQMTAAPGKGVAEFVFDNGSQRTACANLIWDVERSPLSMEGVESESLINYVESNREAAQEATALANSVVAEVTELTERAESAAEAAVNAGVASFNLRTGIVSPASGDYSADMITYGESSDVETELAAIDTKFTDYLKVTSATGTSTSVAADGVATIAVTISASGRYTPIGIVGLNMGTRYVYPWKWIMGTNSVGSTSTVSVDIGVRNLSETYSYSVAPTVYILWVKAD